MSIRRSWHRIRSVVNRDYINAASTVVVALATGAIFFVSIGQWRAIKGQLDVMEAEKRPWIRATVTAVKPVIFTDWNGSKGINVPIKLDLKNYGDTPAVNVRVFPQIAQHPGNPRRRELDAPQQTACDIAIGQADENTIGGIAIFPGESQPDELISGISGIYKTDEPILFSVYGCVDYTYGNNRHGQTGFRMLLGRVSHGQVFGLQFIEGTPIEDYHPSPELLAGGYPLEAPKNAQLQPSDFYFHPDDGGNYAK